MKTLLNDKETQELRNSFSDNAIFAIFPRLFTSYERQLNSLALTPEQVFVNCMYLLDNIRKNKVSNIEDIYDNLFCDIRKAANELKRPYQDSEIHYASLIILLAIVVCCIENDNSTFCMLAYSILDFIRDKDYSFFETGVTKILKKFNDNTANDFCIEISRIFKKDIYLSEQIALSPQKKSNKTRGRQSRHLFHTQKNTEKDVEKTNLWKDLFSRRLILLHASSVKIDTSEHNQIFIQLLGFIEYWTKQNIIDKDTPYTTYTKFLLDDCNIRNDTNKTAIDAFFRNKLNDQDIRANNYDKISETEEWIKQQLL